MIMNSGLFWRVIRPDAIRVWRYKEVKDRLKHYYSVMTNDKPAKYRVVKRVPVDERLQELSWEELWKLHEEKSKEFRELYDKLINEKIEVENLRVPKVSFLDLKVIIVEKIMKKCMLCEWRCSVNRREGVVGRCGLDWRTRVTSAFLHVGEEAPLVPSGTIFFTGCSFKCVFCQNWDISTNPYNGEEVSPEELAKIAIKLRDMGARNINYVGGNPDQQLHTIIKSLKYMDVNVPLLWNSNFYMTVESMKLLVDLIDIWLPDFKYGNDKCAWRLSRVKNYFNVVSRNHSIAYQYGDMIIRHLVLPNHIECCTEPVLRWIAENCPNALVNVMDQYRPEHIVLSYPDRYKDISRRLSSDEIRRAYKIAKDLGLHFECIS